MSAKAKCIRQIFVFFLILTAVSPQLSFAQSHINSDASSQAWRTQELPSSKTDVMPILEGVGIAVCGGLIAWAIPMPKQEFELENSPMGFSFDSLREYKKPVKIQYDSSKNYYGVVSSIDEKQFCLDSGKIALKTKMIRTAEDLKCAAERGHIMKIKAGISWVLGGVGVLVMPGAFDDGGVADAKTAYDILTGLCYAVAAVEIGIGVYNFISPSEEQTALDKIARGTLDPEKKETEPSDWRLSFNPGFMEIGKIRVKECFVPTSVIPCVTARLSF